MDPTVVGIAALYFIATIGIGWWSRKMLKSATDYYVAGRQIGSFVNGLALTSTYLSPASMLGLPAFVFILGYPFWWAMAAIILGMGLATFITAAPLRKYAPTSFADYYADRYGDDRLRWLIAIIAAFGAILYITLSIIGMALFLLAILKVKYIYGVIIGTVIVMLYVIWGGMIATSWNSAFQAALMTIASVIAGIALVMKFGGLEMFHQTVLQSKPTFFNSPADPKPPHPFTGTWIGLAGWFFVWHFGFAVMPYTVVRFFTAMDIRTARRSVFWAALFGGIFYIGLELIGAGAKAAIEMYHPLAQEAGNNALKVMALIQQQYGVGTPLDYSLIAAVEALGNPFVLGVLAAGGLAIAMSTAAGWAMVVNTLFTRDIFGLQLKSRYVQEKPITVARIVSAVFLLVSMLLAINPPALILDLSGLAFIALIASLGPGLILGLWWPRATKTAMWTTAIVMFFLHMFAWLYAKNVLGHHAWFFLNQVLFGDNKAAWLVTPHQVWAVPVGFLLFIIVSLLTKPTEEERVRKYCYELVEEA
ncbi:sodium:solute symporter family protein [Geoglobus acetivorans]|uniref:Acetate permease ActP (Cation/acetate symporter) n=1 Tax=Geoglobus acetivorans TaxID=565033 RepID=A0A0A7GBR5_GEOAI|nr:Acetate permease ActP (cation/acetate symporter) [Geoglobus acetivorans]